MKIMIALAGGLVLALSGMALAADLPLRSAPPVYVPPPPVFTWTGFYVGGYAGGAFGDAKTLDLLDPTFTNGNHLSTSGFTGGGLVGGNYQFNSFVLGLEGDFGYNGLSRSQTYLNAAGGVRHEQLDGDYIGRVRGRAGFAMNNVLIFAAGGVSFTNERLGYSNPANGFTQRASQNETGWNVGGGVEYAFNQNIIGRVEYIYDDLGSRNYLYAPVVGKFDDRRLSVTENTVRAALEYKF